MGVEKTFTEALRKVAEDEAQPQAEQRMKTNRHVRWNNRSTKRVLCSEFELWDFGLQEIDEELLGP